MHSFGIRLYTVYYVFSYAMSIIRVVATTTTTTPLENDMYAKLLLRAVTGSIYPFDTRLPHIVNGKFPTRAYDIERRKFGLDWPIIGHTMVGWVRLENVYESLRVCEADNIKGDFVEAGKGRLCPTFPPLSITGTNCLTYRWTEIRRGMKESGGAVHQYLLQASSKIQDGTEMFGYLIPSPVSNPIRGTAIHRGPSLMSKKDLPCWLSTHTLLKRLFFLC
jgi:hypothetical protein